MKTLRWKFMREGYKSEHGKCKWKKNVWSKPIKKLEMCEKGYHCSKGINQAFSFVQGEILAQVECKGKNIIQSNKEVWESMRIVKAYKWTQKDSVAMAIYAAELVIGIYEKKYPKDDRSRKAIEAAKKWLKNPTQKNKDAAAHAAADAAYAAAYAAYAAALVEKIETWMKKRVSKLEVL